MSRLIRFLFSILVALSPTTVFATDYTWNSPTGGAYSNASNWLPVGVPSATDRAFITLPGTYTVVANQFDQRLGMNVVIGAPSGAQNLQIDVVGTIGSTLDIGPNGTLSFSVKTPPNNNGLFLGSGGVVTNQGRVRDFGGSDIGNFGVSGTFVNLGSLEVTFPDDFGFGMAMNLFLDNRGTVSIDSSGAFSTGITLFAGGSTSGSIILGGKGYLGTRGYLGTQTTLVVNPGATFFTTPGSNFLAYSGGAVQLNTSIDVARFSLSDGSGLRGPGTLRITDLFDWGRGVIENGATVLINPGATLKTNSGAADVLAIDNATVRNDGLFLWQGTSGDITLVNGGRIENSGTFSAEVSKSITGSGSFTNTGLLKTSMAPSSTVAVPFSNSGTVSAESGTLSFTSTFNQTAGSTSVTSFLSGNLSIQGGRLEGTGQLTGSVVNQGTVSPGTPATPVATLRINGTYEQPSSGVLQVDITSSANDVLAVTGAATLAGTLAVSPVGVSSGSFNVATFGSRSGIFDVATGTDLGGGKRLTPIYTATAATLTVTVNPAVGSFTASPSTIVAGSSSTLSWTTTNATSLTIDNGVGSQPVNGSVNVSPTSTTTYTLTANGPGGTATANATVTVNASAPAVSSFTATPSTITTGGSSTLSWTTSNATSVTINNGVGPKPVNGSVSVSPTATTTYTLTATGPGGTTTATAMVTVNASGPVVSSFTATPATITAGGSSTLSWATSNATSVTINNGVGSQPANGSVTVFPMITTTYTLTATGPGGTATATATVGVSAAAPVIISFTATPPSIPLGGSTTLTWSTSNATSVTIAPGLGSQPVNGSTPVSPTAPTTYTLTANGPGGTSTATVQVTVNQAAPQILSFAASPPTIRAGQSTTLVFSTLNAVSVTIDNGVVVSGTTGSVTVMPTQTTTYTLAATGTGSTSATSQVTVPVITSPVVVIADLPDGMLQTIGSAGATDLLSFTNVGGAPATISVTKTGIFFTIAPTTFTIESGATQALTIIANAQPEGNYEGFITAAGSGIQGSLTIPVRLLVSAPPLGTVQPDPRRNRRDVSQPTGTLEFTNSGSGMLQGILVSDAPWLIPQTGVITIAPAQTVTVTFSIDRSKRPDAQSPAGAVTGNIVLVYLDRPSSGATVGLIQALADTADTKRRVAQVIDLAALAPSSGAIPPLGTGEVALFLPGLAKKSNLVSDVILANTTPTSLTGMRLFFARSGAPTTSVPQALASIVPSGKVLLSDVVDGVFKRPEGEVGGVQVRAGNPARLNLAAVLTNPVNEAGFFAGSITSQRSDRAIGFNEKTVLAGVRKDAGAHTDLFVQEVAGQPGSVRTEFFGEDGTVRKTRTDAIGAFAVLELQNEAPSGAVSATITNLGSGSKIIAQGLVLDEQSGDPTNLVDWNRRNGTAATESQIIPLAASGVAGGKRTRTDVWIMNTGTTTATGMLSLYGDPSRKRAVRRNTGGSPGFGSTPIESMETSKAMTVEAGRTRVLRDVLAAEFARSAGNGYLLYTPLTGTVAITSGTFKDSITAEPGAGGGSGTSVPVMATSMGMKAGDLRQFSSLEDASSSSVATAAKATYRTGFGLIETSGKTVTVKATLIYRPAVQDSAAGVNQATGAPLSVTRQYTLTPRGSIFVDQIGSFLGSGRDTLGDLHDLVLEIVVASGEGRVLPYTLSTENGSGDTIMRIE